MTNSLYFIETIHNGHRWFVETDRDSNSRANAISMIRSGEVDPIKVLEVCEDEGTVRDVTEEIKHAAQYGEPHESLALRARLYEAAE